MLRYWLVFVLAAGLGSVAIGAPSGVRLGIRGFERTTFWYVHPGMTDNEIADSVDAFVKAGVTGVIIGGGRHHYLHDDLPFLEDQISVTRRVVEACHARGIKVCEHHSVVLTTRKDYAQGHKDWIQRSLDTGDFSVWPEYQTYAFCPNNTEFREHYWAILSDIVRRTGVDAVMSDDASFHQGCGCAACAARWKQEVGGDIREAYKASRTAGTPEWRRWNTVRQGWYRDFREWLYGRMRTEMPKVQCFSLLGSLLSPWGPQTSGANQEAMLYTGDASWWEIYNPADFYSWRRNAAEAAALYEAGRMRRSDVATLPYADRAEQRDVADPEEETFMWALSKAHGLWFTQARVFLNGLTPQDAPRPYWIFERESLAEYRSAKPAAAIGIFFSRFSRDADPKWEFLHTAPAIGWAESLQDAHVPYRGVVEETLDAGLPGDIQTLIVPDVFALSAKNLSRLERFARDGGTLIATYRTGFCDETGASRFTERKDRLEALYGVRLTAEAGADDGQLRVEPLTARKRPGVPFDVYENKVGKGRVLYAPGLPGGDAFQNIVNEGQPYRDPRKPETVEALAVLAAEVTPRSPVRIEGGKGPILTTVWKQKGRLLIHVVNTGGAQLKDGESVPAPSRVVWADPREMTLTFEKAPKRVRVLSLDPGENRVIDRPGRVCTLLSPRRYGVIVAEW